MTAIVGHAAMELLIVLAMLAGLARLLRTRHKLFRTIKVSGGLVLIVMGVLMLVALPTGRLEIADPSGADGRGHVASLLMGAAVSIGNPYFVLWWATVGLGLLGNAAKSGRTSIPVFYVGHILSDFVWFAFIAGSLALGRETILDATSYRVLLAAGGIFMLAFGAWFAFRRDRSPDPMKDASGPPR